MTQRHVANIALRQQQQCSNEQRSRVVYPQKRKISDQSHRLSDSKLSFRFRPISGHWGNKIHYPIVAIHRQTNFASFITFSQSNSLKTNLPSVMTISLNCNHLRKQTAILTPRFTERQIRLCSQKKLGRNRPPTIPTRFDQRESVNQNLKAASTKT
jgi:hypothetical protein